MRKVKEELDNLTQDWETVRQIIPYGCGLEAHRTLPRILRDFEVPFIVDADPSKQGSLFMGIPVVSPDRLKKLEEGQKVVITIARRRYGEIRTALEQYGLEDSRDFCHISQFAMEWYYKFRGEYSIFTMDAAITTKCSLRCRNCNMFIPHHGMGENISIEEVKENFDLLFDRIDFIFAIGLLGGEVLVHERLGDIITYLYEEHRDQFGSLCITTNGTIMPDEKLLQILKKYGVIVAISDYTYAISDRSKIQDIYKKLEENQIICHIRKDLVWCDFGFPEKPVMIEESRAREHMLSCNPGWRGLGDKTFYFCNVAWSAQKAGLCQLEEGDFLFLPEMEAGTEETKERIVAMSLGIFERGYLSFCRQCGGCGNDNQNFVNAGEQV